jgi:catechol 2,3-dioxygenase-like lactoylglutathione lyase family enzyme
MDFKANKLVPELSVIDLKRSLHFYCEILGFKIEFDRPENSFAYLSFFGSQLMLEQDKLADSRWDVGPRSYPRGQGLNLSIECPDAEALTGKLKNNGWTLQKPMEECWYRNGEFHHGETNFLVLDPDGYMLRFQQDLGMKKIVTP